MALGGHIEVVYVFAASRDNIALPMVKTASSGHKANPNGQTTNKTCYLHILYLYTNMI